MWEYNNNIIVISYGDDHGTTPSIIRLIIR